MSIRTASRKARLAAAAHSSISGTIRRVQQRFGGVPSRHLSVCERLESRVMLQGTPSDYVPCALYHVAPRNTCDCSNPTQVPQNNGNAGGAAGAADEQAFHKPDRHWGIIGWQESHDANGDPISGPKYGWIPDTPAEPGFSTAPVRYFDGQPQITATDVSSDGFGQTYGAIRSYDPYLANTGPMGNRWMMNALPHLFDEVGMKDSERPAGVTDTIIVFSSGSDQRYFDTTNGTTWAERYGGPETLSISGGEAILTDTEGGQTHFYDPSGATNPGEFKSYVDPYGNTTSVTSLDSFGNPAEVQRTNGTAIESWLYAYINNPAQSGNVLLATVLLRRKATSLSSWVSVRQSDYSFFDGSYAGSMQFGNQGDLRSAAISDPNTSLSAALSYSGTTVTATVNNSYAVGDTVVVGGATQQAADGLWVVTSASSTQFQFSITTSLSGSDTATVNKPFDVSFNRYYTPSNDGGVAARDGLIQFVLGPQSYARARAAGYDSATATDANIANYADNQFKYDSSERVTDEYVQGGAVHTQYAYFTKTSYTVTGFNSWKYGTVFTDANGDTTTTYADSAGQVMMSIQADTSGNQWATFYKYDTSGRMILMAMPSAISLPSSFHGSGTDQSYSDLLHAVSGNYQYMNDSTGVVNDLDFYSTGAVGYFQDLKVQQGETGTAILLQTKTYTSHTYNSVTVYPVASEIFYRNTDGTGGETTSLSYTWPATGNRPSSVTVTSPTVGSTENGPGVADVTASYTDPYGRTVWSKDADGHIFYTQYDDATGAVVKSIGDVNTNDTGDFSSPPVPLPTGWVNTSGLELETTAQVDGLGRPIQTVTDANNPTSPDSRTTYIVHNDANHETRTYVGWISQSGTATGGSTTTLVDTGLNPTGSIIGWAIGITSGTDAGKSAAVTAYNAATHTITFSPAFPTNVDTTSHYVLAHTTAPVEVSREYRPATSAPTGQRTLYDEMLASSATPTLNISGTPNGQEVITTAYVTSLGRTLTDATGRVTEVDAYDSLSGQTYSTAVAKIGTAFSNSAPLTAYNYAGMTYGYDADGKQNKVVDPNGTITRTVFDSLERLTATWMGTDDTGATDSNPGGTGSPNNMVDVQDNQYDSGAVGDGNLTRVEQHADSGFGDDHVTLMAYDWRDRLVVTKAGALLNSSGNPDLTGETTVTAPVTLVHRPIIYNLLDNLNEVTRTYQFDGDGVSLGDFTSAYNANPPVPPTADATKVRAIALASYDEQRRIYQIKVLLIDQTNGTSGLTDAQILALPALAGNFYYDHRGDMVAVSNPGGTWGKTGFDGARRVTNAYVTDGAMLNDSVHATGWNDATSINNDIVLQEIDTTYNADSDVIQTLHRARFDNDPINGSGTGALTGPGGVSLASRDSYSGVYYDAADRVTDQVDVGTNGGTAWTRPSSAPTASTDALHLVHTAYDVGGRPYLVTDPRGIQTYSSFDLLGQTTQVIGAYTGGSPANATDQTTNYSYDGNGNVVKMTAVQPSPGGNTPSQTTDFVYGVGGGNNTIFSNDLLATVQFPDKTTGSASSAAADDQTFAYDRLGERLYLTDQNGTTHQYILDSLGRLTADKITAFGTGVNQTIKRLQYAFDTAGRPYQQTSYTDAAGTTIANQVQDAYDGFGQLTTEYQAPYRGGDYRHFSEGPVRLHRHQRRPRERQPHDQHDLPERSDRGFRLRDAGADQPDHRRRHHRNRHLRRGESVHRRRLGRHQWLVRRRLQRHVHHCRHQHWHIHFHVHGPQHHRDGHRRAHDRTRRDRRPAGQRYQSRRQPPGPCRIGRRQVGELHLPRPRHDRPADSCQRNQPLVHSADGRYLRAPQHLPRRRPLHRPRRFRSGDRPALVRQRQHQLPDRSVPIRLRPRLECPL